jgi:hypothetical protein
LRNLLQAGTIALNVRAEITHDICVHKHAEDGWHPFDASALLPRLSDPKHTVFCRELDFLIKQSFISITYHCADNGSMVLRIYLIPYDLPNVQGKLRVRKNNVLKPAKRFMCSLLFRIVQDPNGWMGLPLTGDAKTLIPERTV